MIISAILNISVIINIEIPGFTHWSFSCLSNELTYLSYQLWNKHIILLYCIYLIRIWPCDVHWTHNNSAVSTCLSHSLIVGCVDDNVPCDAVSSLLSHLTLRKDGRKITTTPLLSVNMLSSSAELTITHSPTSVFESSQEGRLRSPPRGGHGRRWFTDQLLISQKGQRKKFLSVVI